MVLYLSNKYDDTMRITMISFNTDPAYRLTHNKYQEHQHLRLVFLAFIRMFILDEFYFVDFIRNLDKQHIIEYVNADNLQSF